MKTILCAALIACAGLPSIAQAESTSAALVVAGKTLFDASGKNIGVIYKVTVDGSPQIVIDDQRLITIPATSISQVDGKLRTSMTKRDVLKLR